jgi:hypothetical protein
MLTYTRPLSDDDRALMTHISLWGSTGYPVRRLGSRWTWDYRSLSAPGVYKTRREAVAAFETYMAVLRDCYSAEAYRRALANT